jgi:hypothetical protein
MNIATSEYDEQNQFNIITPTACCLGEAVQYPTLDDWINVLLDCLMNAASWISHWKLHNFLEHWNNSLDPGWLRILLSNRCSKSGQTDGSFITISFVASS